MISRFLVSRLFIAATRSISKRFTPKIIACKMSTNKAPVFDNVRAEIMTGILSHTKDTYDGVIINSNELPSSVDEFVSVLNASIMYWRSTKRRGVWLKVPIEKSELIAPAVAAGFTFHHAEKSYLMLNHWLSDEENRMPANATHQVGVGNVVILDGKILAVQERTGPLRGTGIWKMPTGLADAGEDICDTAVREVFEETGIETEFVSILCVRQSHTALFGKSDLFFICLLRPKTTEIKMQAAEIVACEWLDPELFLGQKFFMKSPIFMLVNEHVRAAAKAVLNDPAWSSAGCGMNSSNNDNSNTGNNGSGVDGKSGDSNSLLPPVSSFVNSKLPNGIRPGESVLYHMPLEIIKNN